MRVEDALRAKCAEMQRELEDAVAAYSGSGPGLRPYWFGWRDVAAMCVLLDALAQADDGADFGACSRRLRETGETLQLAEKQAEAERQEQLNRAGLGQSRCPHLTATEIGRILVPTLQPTEVNKLLVDLGLLELTDQGWFATAAADPYVHQQIKATAHARGFVYWNKTVLDPVLRLRKSRRR